jgi:hypothetical protein
LETSPPTGTISINSDASATSSTSVSLNLTASDSGIGLIQMAFSNDGTGYTNWEPFNFTKNWSLSSGDGTKTVYVKYKDFAGF